MKNKLLLVLIDALRYDFITQETTPFMYSLMKKNSFAKLQETFGFNGIRAANFAGLPPSNSNYAFLYAAIGKSNLEGISSYFLYYSLLQPFKKYYFFLQLKFSKLFSPTKVSPWDYACIPKKLLKYFYFYEEKAPWHKNYLSSETIFDLLKKHGDSFLYLGYPNSNQKTTALEKAFYNSFKKNTPRLTWIHFAEVDWAQHKYGPESSQTKKALFAIDRTMQRIYSYISRNFDCDMIIFGDHGCVEVKHHIDIEKLLTSLHLQLGKDYIYFLDSTFARFWFFNRNAKTIITSALSKLKSGKILNEKILKKHHANFSSNLYGDLFFVVHESYIIFPNFFQRNNPDKGMHGYLPDVDKNMSAFLIHTKRDIKLLGKKYYYMQDIYPTILTLLNYPIPSTNKGKLMIK